MGWIGVFGAQRKKAQYRPVCITSQPEWHPLRTPSRPHGQDKLTQSCSGGGTDCPRIDKIVSRVIFRQLQKKNDHDHSKADTRFASSCIDLIK